MATTVPLSRIQFLNDAAANPDGDFVLYWMIAFRRMHWNFALQRAVELARDLGKPLLVVEALRCDYRWASDRIHQFVVDGMIDNAAAFEKTPVTYYPYLEEKQGDGRGMMRALCQRAAAVVTDDFPCFFLPRMVQAVALRCPVTMESVDSNGLYPMRDTDRVFSRAHYFRRHLQKTLLPHLQEMPKPDPLARMKLSRLEQVPVDIAKRWPATDLTRWKSGERTLKELPIDHSVAVSRILPGGYQAAQTRLQEFVNKKVANYEDRNQPERDVASGLSPYLHFGHISAHQIFAALVEREGWTPDQVAPKSNGSASGWWNMSEPVEGFLDELITWREVGYNMCCLTDDYDQYESLPDWAQTTLAEHESDQREYIYSLDEFASAATHDPLWNAAQNQLVHEGRMHNYLRMLWGKKILEWTATPREALDVMVELNNKYALDGRNPNSYSGIFWVLGRYDRAWGPERPVFGKIRYMSSDNTARKVRVKNYMAQYASNSQRTLL